MTLYGNAIIYASNGIKSWMLIKDGVFQSLGDGDPPSDEFIDLGGKLVLPGLIDSHIHILGMGKFMDALDLRGVGSISALQNKLLEYSENRDGWILGRGWDQDIFEDKRYPNASDIDAVVKDLPVILYRACNHIALVNSKAIEIAKIDYQSPNPPGGIIDRDESGKPTGILREKAMDLVSGFTKITEYRDKKRVIGLGLQACVELGLTMVQSNDSRSWNIYREIQRDGDLPLRVVYTPYHNEIGERGTPTPGSRDGWLYSDRVKLFADGSLGAQTAALREPYADTGEMGITTYEQRELNQLVREAYDAGYRLEIHAIGDRAAEMVIHAYEQNGDISRPILTHAQILGEDLVERLSKLGIIASIQPPFIITDGNWVDRRLGDKKRLKYAYAWKTMLDGGVSLAGGSDAPIESASPLLGMYSAIFRETSRGEVWREDECLDFDQALQLYTTGGAFATGEEKMLGKISQGYSADFIVLDDNVVDDPRLLKDARVNMVVVEGQITFSRV